jgi:hypothetical protein
MAKPTITIDQLAKMINEGFKSTASKEDIKEVTIRWDRIEHLLLAEQKREIEDLKTRMKRLEDALAVSPQIDQRPQHTGRRWRGGQDQERARPLRPGTGDPQGPSARGG